MVDPKVIEYIKSEIAKGVSKDEIIKNLMQGGGWTLADIQTHFLLAEQNQNSIPVNLVQNSQPNNMQIQPKKKINIFGINFIIFITYYILGVIFWSSIGEDVGGPLVAYAYMVHALILVIISIFESLRGSLSGVKTSAGQYFLTATLILIIGFGACTFAVFNYGF